MKSVLIIGMGRFGRHMAQKLYDLGHDVLAIDKNEEKINKVLSYVTNARNNSPIKRLWIKTCCRKSRTRCTR